MHWDLTKLILSSTLLRASTSTNALEIKRQAFKKAAVNLFDSASAHAQLGDIEVAATFILKALDQERRASVVGPQVLQLIKN